MIKYSEQSQDHFSKPDGTSMSIYEYTNLQSRNSIKG